MSGKRVVPFITHGGYGVGNSLSFLKTHAPEAEFQPEFVMEADQERRTLEAVSSWLDTGPAID
ncbi:flavodoxin [Rhizobium leguminosarum]|uniref:flavodoxin n=1 Tax=Rhizobium leguminosarum TaxID=384 RepID=UPI003F993049